MRTFLACCVLLLGIPYVWTQPPGTQTSGPYGRIAPIRIARAQIDNGPGSIREPAPFGQLHVDRWNYDPNQKYPLSLVDTYGNTWFVAFESSQEHFNRYPDLIRGWIMIIDGGCLRIGSVRGSYLLSSTEMKGKGIPGSFEILSSATTTTARGNEKISVPARKQE